MLDKKTTPNASTMTPEQHAAQPSSALAGLPKHTGAPSHMPDRK